MAVPLRQELVNARRAFLARLSEDKAAVIGVAETLLRSSGMLTSARRTGDRIPPFVLEGVGGEVDLGRLLARGPAVVTFIQGGWSPFCRLELTAWQRMMPYARALRIPVLAVSPQTVAENLRTRTKLNLSFDLLHDAGNSVAAAWGLSYSLPPMLRHIYRQLGVDLERINGDRNWSLPVPATYVLDTGGRVAASFADLDVSHRMEPIDALMAASSLLTEAADELVSA